MNAVKMDTSLANVITGDFDANTGCPYVIVNPTGLSPDDRKEFQKLLLEAAAGLSDEPDVAGVVLQVMH